MSPRRTAGAIIAVIGVLCTACGADTGAGRSAPLTSTVPATTSSHAPEVPAVAVPTVAKPTATAAIAARPNPCSGNRAPQLVKVTLSVQHMWMCEHLRLVFSTPITSGIPGEYTSTPTGTFTVQALTRNTTLTLINGQTYDVKYWIPFQGPLFGFHDSSWQNFPFGSREYRTDGSHGCVHMPLKSIAFLYKWAAVGAKVRIRT